MKKMALLLITLILSGVVVAHSGGTDAAGCHEDNSPGGVWHCH